MASVNKVILVGNLGADPETRYAPSGDAICSILLATTESWKDKASGEKREAAQWHRVVFYRKLAEIAGQDRYTTEIEATEMQMLGGRGDGNRQGSDAGGQPDPAPRNRPASKPAPSSRQNDFEDDIPF